MLIARIILFSTFLLFIDQEGIAQDWLGYNTDNYAGVNRMQIQPASIAASPYFIDANILGLDVNGYNARFFTNFKFANEINEVGQGSFFKSLKDGESEYLVNAHLLMPAIMITLDDKSALGISIRTRSRTNLETSGSEISELLIDDFSNEDLFQSFFEDAFLKASLDNWIEYGITYAREVYSTPEHRIRAGLTTRLLAGVGSGYVSLDNLRFQLANADTLRNVSGTLQFGYSQGLDNALDGQLDLFQNTTFGINLGVEYEWRKTTRSSTEDWQYDPGYRLKIGVSYLDQGTLKFSKTENSFDYSVDINNLNLNSLREVGSVEELADTLNNLFQPVETDPNFRVKLPATLAFQFDYHIKGHFYANFSPFLTLKGKRGRLFQVRNPNKYALAVRYERRHYAFSMPVFFNSISGTQVGLSTRLGPLVLGSGNVLSSLFSDSNNLNIFAAVKIYFWKPAHKKKK